jgi:hypothetical protein
MPPHVRNPCNTNDLRRWKSLLHRSGNDLTPSFAKICTWVYNRLRITGSAPATGVSGHQTKFATLTEAELMDQREFARPAIIGKAKGQPIFHHG